MAPALSWVALSVVLSGVLTYGYLALVARSLPADEYGWFGAYWSLALVVGLGAFLPIELEVTRLVHLGGGGGLPRGAGPACAVLTAASLAAVLLAAPLLLPALGGSLGLLLALGAVCVVSAGQFLLRGLLLGNGRYGSHGTVLLADAAARVACAAAVAALVQPADAAAFGWTLVAALVLAHLPLLGWLALRPPRAAAGGAAPERLRLPPLGHLAVGTLCAQALLNAAPVLVTGTAGPGEGATAAAFVAAFTLVRLPLFVAVPLQSALLPTLTDVTARPESGPRRRLLVRLLAAVAALAAVGGVLGALAGPPLVALLFGERYAVAAGIVAVLAVGSVLHVGLLVCSQGVVAAGRHRDSALAWGAGLAVAAGVAALVPGTATRGAWAFTAGTAAALAWCTVTLLRHRPQPVPVPIPPGGGLL
ncbi:hypothetical protein [Geodermatophilus sp. CPCC 206100]|uniref:hypothetical protein n=1 Tax=Geodermatophilus sp. CPCC 206100 TaxID=3020054 RepID=UPI003B0012AB